MTDLTITEDFFIVPQKVCESLKVADPFDGVTVGKQQGKNAAGDLLVQCDLKLGSITDNVDDAAKTYLEEQTALQVIIAGLAKGESPTSEQIGPLTKLFTQAQRFAPLIEAQNNYYTGKGFTDWDNTYTQFMALTEHLNAVGEKAQSSASAEGVPAGTAEAGNTVTITTANGEISVPKAALQTMIENNKAASLDAERAYVQIGDQRFSVLKSDLEALQDGPGLINGMLATQGLPPVVPAIIDNNIDWIIGGLTVYSLVLGRVNAWRRSSAAKNILGDFDSPDIRKKLGGGWFAKPDRAATSAELKAMGASDTQASGMIRGYQKASRPITPIRSFLGGIWSLVTGSAGSSLRQRTIRQTLDGTDAAVPPLPVRRPAPQPDVENPGEPIVVRRTPDAEPDAGLARPAAAAPQDVYATQRAAAARKIKADGDLATATRKQAEANDAYGAAKDKLAQAKTANTYDKADMTGPAQDARRQVTEATTEVQNTRTRLESINSQLGSARLEIDKAEEALEAAEEAVKRAG